MQMYEIIRGVRVFCSQNSSVIRKKSGFFVDKKSEETNGVVRGSRWVSTHEMWKRKQNNTFLSKSLGKR